MPAWLPGWRLLTSPPRGVRIAGGDIHRRDSWSESILAIIPEMGDTAFSSPAQSMPGTGCAIRSVRQSHQRAGRIAEHAKG